jgi:PAS domain S-box-containing protein
MITDVSQEHQICYVNPAFERLSGYPATEAIGQYPWLLLGKDREQAESGAISTTTNAVQGSQIIV